MTILRVMPPVAARALPRRGRVPSSALERTRALAGAAGSAALVVLAGYVVVYLLRVDVAPVDFHVYRDAAEAIAAGESPYPGFAYPPLTALAAVPFTFLSTVAADFLVKALLIAGVVAILAVAGVRDWRCYPLAFLWPPVNAAVQTGNITIPLALAAALMWRFRDRAFLAGLGLGASIATKLYLWPLWIWLVATGRRAAGAWSIAAAVAITVASWAVVDLSGLVGYPERLQSLDQATSGSGYTIDAVAGDLGAGATAARLLAAAVAVSILVAVVVVGRAGADKRCFVLAVAAALACSPIVWLHYFALLLVPVAVVSSRLGVVWFAPLAMWGFGAGSSNGSTMDTAVVLVVAASTFALAVRAAPPSRPRGAMSPPTRAAPAGGRP